MRKISMQDPSANFTLQERSVQDLDTRTFQEPPPRLSYQHLTLMQDLFRRISPASPQDLLLEEAAMREFTMKMSQTKTLRTSRSRLCASLRSRMHMDISLSIHEQFIARSYRKISTPQDRDNHGKLCATPHHRNAHGQEAFHARIYRKHAASQEGGPRSVLREPAQSKCIWTAPKGQSA